jgi:cell division protein FtsQ
MWRMWHRPQLLRLVATLLLGVSLALVSYSVLRYVLQLPVFKIRTVQLSHAPQQVDLLQLNQLVKRAVGGSFFTIDLEKTRSAFEQLPWVRKVSIRRHFPWGLEVTLEEHVAMARWNGVALVNTYGEEFAGQSKADLPEFNGEPDTSKQVADLYLAMNRQLGTLQRTITQINLSARFAWQVRLDNGMLLALGREQMLHRVNRFVSVYPYSLANASKQALYVDLRYRNGFTVAYVNTYNGLGNNNVVGKQHSRSRV